METKPAYLTTEFWVMLFSQAGGVVNLLGWWNFAPNKWTEIAMAVLGGLYTVGRGQAKSGVPYDPNAHDAYVRERKSKAARRKPR